MQQRQASHTSSAAHVANATADQLSTTGQSVPQFVRNSTQQQTTTTTTTTGNYMPATAYGQTVTNAAGEQVTTYSAPTTYTMGGEHVVTATSYPNATAGETITTTYQPSGQKTTYQQAGPVAYVSEQTATTSYQPAAQTTTTYTVTAGKEGGATTHIAPTFYGQTYKQATEATYTKTAGEQANVTYQPATAYSQTTTSYKPAGITYNVSGTADQATTTTTYQPTQGQTTITYTQEGDSSTHYQQQSAALEKQAATTVRYTETREAPHYVTTTASNAQIAGEVARQYISDSQQVVGDAHVTQEGHTVVSHQTTVSRHAGDQVVGTRVIGHETGAHRLLSVTERVDESRSTVLSQNTISHEIRVPRRIVREELIEKVIIVPEKKLVEEIVDDIQTVKETIIEVAKPTIVEKVIEVPEIEIVERIVEVPEKKTEERIVYIDKVVEQKRTVGEPTIVYVDKEVEVPVPVDVWRDVEKVVEVPAWYDEIIYKEVRVPQYKDVIVEQRVEVPRPVEVYRDLPVPVEAEVSYEYRMPQLKPRYARVAYPVFLPRFIEVPVAAEMLNPELTALAHKYLNQVSLLIREAASMCEIEGLAAEILKTDFQKQMSSTDLQSAVLRAWKNERIGLKESDAVLKSGVVTTSQQRVVETTQVETTQSRSMAQTTL